MAQFSLTRCTGLALSLASEFIENPAGRSPTDYQEQKQDCELKGFDRLAGSHVLLSLWTLKPDRFFSG